jgi:hypothetical protein
MGTAWVECWKCDVCGHRWIKGELYPEQCAKCRSRKWNSKEQSTVMRRYVRKQPESSSDLVERAPLAQGEGTSGSIPLTSSKPSMDALRAICAGNVPTIPDPEPIESPMCSYREWVDGEQYACGLRAHSSKVKHTRGTAIL